MEEARRTLAVLSIVVFLVLLGISIIAPGLPLYAEELQASELLVGVAVGAYAGARVVLDIPAGYLADRRGHKAMMTMGLLLIGFSSLAAGLALNVTMLIAVRVVEGIGSAFYTTSSVALLARVSPPDRRGAYMSLYTGSLLLGAVVGPLVGGFAADRDLRLPFFLYAACGFAGLALQGALLPRGALPGRDAGGPGGREAYASVLTPSFLLVNLGVMAAFFTRGALFTIYPLFALARFGWDALTVGLLFTLNAVASLATMFPSGRWADRRGRRLPFVLSLLLSGLLLPFLVLGDGLAAEAALLIVLGLAWGLTGPMAAWAADLAPPENLGAAMGVFRMVGDVGWLAGPVAAGAAAEMAGRTSVLPFLLAGLVAIALGLLLLRADDPAARRRGPPTVHPSPGPPARGKAPEN